MLAGVTGHDDDDDTLTTGRLWLDSSASFSLFRGVGVVSLLSDVFLLTLCCCWGVAVALLGAEIEEDEGMLIPLGPSLEARVCTGFFLLVFF